MTNPPKLPESVWVVFRDDPGVSVSIIARNTKRSAIGWAVHIGTFYPWPTLRKRGWRVAKYELKGKPDA
jgi:hypothetical protein